MQALTALHLGVETMASAASGSCWSVFATMMGCMFKPWARINPLPLKRLLSGCFASAVRETKKLVLSAPSLCDLGPSIPSPHAEVTSQHTYAHSFWNLLKNTECHKCPRWSGDWKLVASSASLQRSKSQKFLHRGFLPGAEQGTWIPRLWERVSFHVWGHAQL